MAYRGSNPVSAFLAGFQAVDALETNRQNRAFREKQMEFAVENQSRARRMWERQDDEYELVKLDRYREQKAIEFDEALSGLMTKITAQIDAAEKAGDTKTVNALRDRWFTGENTDSNIINEVINTMTANDSDFAEHVALHGYGKDVAKGPLVADRSKPVSGMGFHPDRGNWFTVNSVNGMQPMTENRTSAGNDSVFFGKLDGAGAARIFGKHYNSGEMDAMRMLRSYIGDTPTGQPAAAKRAAESSKKPGLGDVSEEENAKNQAEYAERQAAADARRAAEQQAPEDEAVVTDAVEVAGSEADKKRDDFERTRQELMGEGKIPGPEPFNERRTLPEHVARAAPSAKKGLEQTSLAPAAKVVSDIVSGTPNTFIGSAIKSILNIGPKSAAQINAAARDNGTPTAKESNANSETSQEVVDKTPPPASEEAKAEIATSLANTQGSYKRPPPEEVYKAYMMAKAGMLDIKDVARFKRTGRLDEPALRKLQVVKGEDGAYAVLDITGDAAGRGQPVSSGQIGSGGGGGAATVADQQRIVNLMQDVSKGLFEDNPQGQQQFIDAAEGAYTAMGLPGQTKEQLDARANPDNLNAMTRGASFVRYYDHDDAQNLFQGTGDFNPLPGSDLKIPMTAGNLALGAAADMDGVTSQSEANEYLTAYAGKFYGANQDLSARELYLNARQHEQTVLARLQAGNDPTHPKYEQYKGQSRAKIRRELVEELIGT